MNTPEDLQQELEEFPQMTPQQEVQQNVQYDQFFEEIWKRRLQKDQMQHSWEHCLSSYPCETNRQEGNIDFRRFKGDEFK